jgi:hypothetical protein
MTSGVAPVSVDQRFAEVEMPAVDLRLTATRRGEAGAWTDHLTGDDGRGCLRDD